MIYDIINTNRIPNPDGFVIDVFIDVLMIYCQ